MKKRWTLEDINNKGLKLSNSTTLNPSKSVELKLNNQPASFALGRMKSGEMNKTEIAYANYLESKKRIGEVLWYKFEPMNLKIADKCFYKIDFMVMVKSGQLECHEVKGFWTDDALVKIKAAAAMFPFRFIAVILKKGEWEIREF